ncbi:MAG: F0F1 ATP synthase subunit delta [Pseudomonadota bacterium]|nr:F0F1 ATP synthase subunit delta [Pseudomonadota bacterium]
MAELATLARPYAKAAFDFASTEGNSGVWQRFLDDLAMYMSDSALIEYLRRPTLQAQDKVKAITDLSERNHTIAFKNFLSLLAENDRLELIPAIATEFGLLKAHESGEIDVTIESAFPLTQSQELLLTSRLEKRYSKKVNATVVVRPELIAGVIIRAGDQVIDDSALGKLEKMRIRLSA